MPQIDTVGDAKGLATLLHWYSPLCKKINKKKCHCLKITVDFLRGHLHSSKDGFHDIQPNADQSQGFSLITLLLQLLQTDPLTWGRTIYTY